MGLIGNIWVKLGLKSDDYQKGMDKAHSRAEKFGSSLGKITAKMVVGWAAVSAAVIKLFRTSVQNFNEQEAATRKLQNSLRNTGDAIGLNYEELSKFAGELQKVNGIADDATLNAMATLTTFRSVQGEVFKKTIAAAQDMATFMGTDLNSAVQQLGKALESPLQGMAALRRSGVVFSEEMQENIRKLIADGKQYEAQLLILEEVNKRFGGEAARQADTAAGQWKRVGMAFGDLTEHIGRANEATKSLASSLASALETADKIISSNALTGWQKLGVFLGIGQEKAIKLMLAEDEMAQHAQAYAQKAVAGIHSVEEAQAALRREMAANSRVSSDQAKADTAAAVAAIRARISQYQAEAAVKEEERQRAAAAAAEEARKQQEWEEQHTGILNELRDEIAVKEKLLGMAKDRSELIRLQQELAVLREQLKAYEKLGIISGGGELPALSGIMGKAEPTIEVKVDTSSLESAEKKVNIFTRRLHMSTDEVQQYAVEFSAAVENGFIAALDDLAKAIGTGDWDASAMLKSLLNPFADACISTGVLISGAGQAVEAFKKALESLNGWVAIAAGAALIATGVGVKAGLAHIAKNGSAGSAGSAASNPYTYAGGYGVNPAAVSSLPSQLEINVVGTVKGQDLQLALDNYNKNRRR